MVAATLFAAIYSVGSKPLLESYPAAVVMTVVAMVGTAMSKIPFALSKIPPLYTEAGGGKG